MSDCMTQEDAERMDAYQAVQILKPLRSMMLDQYGCPISAAYFALGKAIEALEQPTVSAPCWHRVEEPPKKTGKYAVCWTYQEKIYWDWLIFIDGNWELHEGLPLPDYWMTIEPPQEDA